jgi:phosphoribosyl 1,2-cyclic phosphate phosphodiesterase
MRVVFLGTATSYGVPQIGCRCETCLSTDPKNKRTRSSIFVETDSGVNLLVDCGPEMRLQALREGVDHVDAVLFTHFHADHTAGIDDLKAFNAALGGVLPCYGDAETQVSLRQRFSFAFEGTPWVGLIPHITYTVVRDTPFMVNGLAIQPIPMQHGRIGATGYRIGPFAYLTDTNRVPQESRALLRGLDTVVVDCLRWERHPTHLSVPEARELIDDLAPRQAYLTHVSHALEHHATTASLQGSNVQVAYDGLVLDIPETHNQDAVLAADRHTAATLDH